MEQLKDQIIAGIPDGLSMMEQIRYLYIELGKMVSLMNAIGKAIPKCKRKSIEGLFAKRLKI